MSPKALLIIISANIAVFIATPAGLSNNMTNAGSSQATQSPARDPFAFSPILRTEIAALRAKEKVAEDFPSRVQVPEVRLPIATLQEALKLQAIVTKGSSQFVIINGKLLRKGDEIDVRIGDDNVRLTIVDLQAGPPRVTIKYQNETFICTLKSQGEPR